MTQRLLIRRFPVMKINMAIGIGGGLLLVLIVLSLAAPFLHGLDPAQIRPRLRLKPPNAELWFGTDAIGRDVLSRVIFGGRTSLLVGATSALAGGVCGTVIGLIAGASRVLDAIIMRIMDGVMAIPALLLAIAMVSLLRPSLFTIVAAIAFAEIPRVTRLVRGVVLTVREEAFVQAAQGLGLPRRIILFRHILPSCMAPLVVQATYMFAAAILFEAVLGFLGVGFPPDIPSWGNILAEGRAVFQRAPWTIIFPGLFLAITVLAVNILGDGLRDRLDPRLSRMTKVSA
ncbi:ABC transporter permease [Bradyrhizobium sp. CCBAU 51627]|uniref:ABC transporter permease n=1 Tax=Bradyrhizobium sp. CCBAU 51627 TaxID=1325088 RepID=UPI00230504FC|nr:ABC transporter permease [Bradyrhizobium sp. CCBAU 51627]MDA9433568.1 peptide ABC transporter permease [Bradyrhizobium sp. CCBAU 51627]